MPKPFPISIDGTRFASARALANDIVERGENCVLPDRAVGHPSAYYERWMGADDSGAVRDAVLAACALIIDDVRASGDAFDHAVQLVGSNGTEKLTERILERVGNFDIPDSRHFGNGDDIALRSLGAVTWAVESRYPGHRAWLAGLLEQNGDFYGASDLLLGGTKPDLDAVDVVSRWASTRPIDPDEATTLARRSRRHPEFVVPMATALRGANAEAKQAFQDAIDKYAPDRSADVAAALGA